MRNVIVCVLSVWLCAAANAQTAGLKDGLPERPPPALPLYGGPQPPLAPKERKAVSFGKEWAANTAGPARGNEGATVFVFGSTLPTIVCAPLYVCDLALQEGETVNDLNVGDSVRWKITPATQGTGDTLITHVIIKPTDVGLITNLVITTNRRTYIVKLLSRAQDWMPRVAFDYPGRREQPMAGLPRKHGRQTARGVSGDCFSAEIRLRICGFGGRTVEAFAGLYRWQQDLHSLSSRRLAPPSSQPLSRSPATTAFLASTASSTGLPRAW